MLCIQTISSFPTSGYPYAKQVRVTLDPSVGNRFEVMILGVLRSKENVFVCCDYVIWIIKNRDLEHTQINDSSYIMITKVYPEVLQTS